MNILDTFRLDDRVAIVADAASPTGLAFATALVQAGANVALAAGDISDLDGAVTAVRGAGRTAFTVAYDITDPDAATALVDSVVTEFGRVDVLVNNAEICTATAAIGESVEHFREIVDTNLNGSYWLAQACGRVMHPGSSIVNMSSILAVTTIGAPLAAYSATKAAISGLTRDLAQQWGSRRGIRVNAIASGFFDDADDHPLSRVILGRTGRTEELAAALVWLASDASSYVTGQTLVVDGGASVT